MLNDCYIEQVKNMHKEIIYWGIGFVCNCCLESYPEIEPSFFVDTYAACKSHKQKAVKCPEEIRNWSAYYVVIAVKANEAKIKIQKFLEEKGLTKGDDFCAYNEFFPCFSVTFKKSICLVDLYMKEHSEVMNPALFHIPLEGMRNHKVYINFMSKYIQKRGLKNCIIVSPLYMISRELAEKKIKCPVIPVPTGNISVSKTEKKEIIRSISDKLTKTELRWLKELQNRKKHDDEETEFYDSVELYYYYKSIIKIIKPSKIVIWSNWNNVSYILGHLAQIYNIPCGYMEYGWIPGTYQVDPRGIAGQSEYAANPQMFENIEIKNIYNIGKVKQYVKNNKLDTQNFNDTEADNNALLKINKQKKKIFLVGMDDCGMKMNPKSDYWKSYVSNVVESTEEAFFLLMELCKKNGWNLIFKPHPKNPVPELGEHPEEVIFIKDMEVDRLIELADVVVSIASAVDYKALIYGKPLVQLGITGLRGKGCTYGVFEKKDLEEQVMLALKDGMTEKQTENFDRLLQILLQKYLWDDMSERSLRYGQTIDHDFLEGEFQNENSCLCTD